MANILVINTGSTSIKFALFDLALTEIARGQIEHVDNYDEAIKGLLRQNIHHGEVVLIGHRVVHGGVKFSDPLEINEDNLDILRSLSKLAPLHNPHNIAGIEAGMRFMPNIRQIAVFDTMFYAGMPKVSKIYGLPQALAEEHGLYRFGFHGLSHEYVLQEAARELGERPERLNIISAHLGGGSSVTAIKNGKPIETSMGYSPNEGLMMLSRTGDIDPNLVLDLFEFLPGEVNKDKVANIRALLNSGSGIKAMTGIDDFKLILREYSLGQSDTTTAFNLFMHRLIKTIGAYHCLLEGRVNALVLTGSIGAGQPLTKETLAARLRHLQLPILTVKTNEELMIAQKAKAFIEN